MPAVKVYARTIEPKKKTTIAKKFCAAVQEYLKVPIVEIIFFDMDRIYGNDEREHCLLEMEGPTRSADIIERMGQAICNIFLEESGRMECNVSVIYHTNSQELVVNTEGSLANTLERKRKADSVKQSTTSP